jgi:hypothetical protein
MSVSVDQLVDIRLQQNEPLVDLVLIGSLGKRRGHVAVGDLGYVRDQFGQPVMDAVDWPSSSSRGRPCTRNLNFSRRLPPRINENSVAFADGQQNRVQHLVDARHDAA